MHAKSIVGERQMSKARAINVRVDCFAASDNVAKHDDELWWLRLLDLLEAVDQNSGVTSGENRRRAG